MDRTQRYSRYQLGRLRRDGLRALGKAATLPAIGRSIPSLLIVAGPSSYLGFFTTSKVNTAWLAATGLAALLGLRRLVDNWRSNQGRRARELDYAFAFAQNARRYTDAVAPVHSASTPDQLKQDGSAIDAVNGLLRTVQRRTELIVRGSARIKDIETTLYLYEGDAVDEAAGTGSITIFARAGDRRDIDVRVNAWDAMGHYACLERADIEIGDRRALPFPGRPPDIGSQHSESRSFMLLPILNAQPQSSKYTVPGFIAISSTEAYRFGTALGPRIVAEVSPCVNLLASLLRPLDSAIVVDGISRRVVHQIPSGPRPPPAATGRGPTPP